MIEIHGCGEAGIAEARAQEVEETCLDPFRDQVMNMMGHGGVEQTYIATWLTYSYLGERRVYNNQTHAEYNIKEITTRLINSSHTFALHGA